MFHADEPPVLVCRRITHSVGAAGPVVRARLPGAPTEFVVDLALPEPLIALTGMRPSVIWRCRQQQLMVVGSAEDGVAGGQRRHRR